MSVITQMNIPEVNVVAGNLAGLAADFRAAVERMKQLAAQLDGCWSDDEFGKKFAESYLPQATSALDAGNVTVDSLKALEENLRKLAEYFAQVDTRNGGVLTLND